MDADRIVLFSYPFPYFQNKYGYCQIQIRSGCYLNTNMDRMFFQYETDTNNKIIDLYLIVSQLYNDIIHNSLKFNHKKNTFDHDVYTRFCSCRQCWASKCRGL
jgi:hypothetical protein